MAVVADIEGVDLVVEPHQFSAEERMEFRRAVEEWRRLHPAPRLVQEATQFLAQRHAVLTQPESTLDQVRP